MPNTIALDPRRELRPAVEHLPTPPAKGTLIGLGVERVDAEPIAVEFRSDVRRIGRDLEWVYDGPLAVSSESALRSDDDLAAWLRDELGDRCQEVRIQSRGGSSLLAMAFFAAAA